VTLFDAAPMRAAMQRTVDADLLAGLSCAVLVGRETAAVHCTGWADRERGIALREDHLFRAFSNTKLVTPPAPCCCWSRRGTSGSTTRWTRRSRA
jgi:CubicO group peptidase (beta-lactamase class C family)